MERITSFVLFLGVLILLRGGRSSLSPFHISPRVRRP